MSEPVFHAFAPPVRAPTPLRRAITAAYRRPEAECMLPLLEQAALPADRAAAGSTTAHELVTALRAKRGGNGVESLMQEFALSSEEGVALMCLAEALLRIPDTDTRDALIRDKIAHGDWKAHIGGGRSLFVHAATWGLIVTGRLLDSVNDRGLSAALSRLIARAGEPVIRGAVDLAMRTMGERFVVGETIGEALHRARAMEGRGFAYSYDMLGEAAMTATDAARYYRDYENAIHAIGKVAAGRGIYAGPGISIKLSALHPRYTRSQAGRVMGELLPRVTALAALARSYGIGFNIDAEEADRLELSLDLFESLACDSALAEWDGLGFVVQAYGKRCPFVIDWIVDLARRAGRRIMVRLVKGAYWDAEIKRAQVDGLADFPVYTRKMHTDVAYIACARKLLAASDAVFPQFATHNAQTLASIYHIAGPNFATGDYEFQCLHGMGEALYQEVVGPSKLARPCRIYAPVGTHENLLAYLVRRLLENGANSSFIHRIGDPDVPVADLIADPVAQVRGMAMPGRGHERIALPPDLFPDRRNSAGLDLTDESVLAGLSAILIESAKADWHAKSQIAGLAVQRPARAICNPADRNDRVGTVAFAEADDARYAARVAAAAAAGWRAVPVQDRAAMLERAADAMQARMPVLLGLIVREAGKALPDAIGEVRETVDFLRYYAVQARATLTGADRPLGPVVCISPWNFPLSIFTGQVAAALVAGNPVLAKPAEQTPLVAAEGVRLLHEAGVPQDVLQLLCGEGAIGAELVAAAEVAGVIFTGSTEVARSIQRQLAGRLSPSGLPIPLVAETGGLNAMIVDSSALAEQVVADVIASAFNSAGQRCSALRILCLQEDIAERTLAILKGAMKELRVGRPDRLAVDVGPVIDAEAQEAIEAHIDTMRARGYRVTQQELPPEAGAGTFVPPTLIELDAVGDLEREVFGPVLHVVRYRREALDTVIAAINASGYGLTFGLHTRIDGTAAHVTQRVQAGNIYVNRNVIGAVVGVQPFGGRGLSGTGPKAGGPLYLRRLVQPSISIAPPPDMLPDRALHDLAAWLDGQGEQAMAQAVRAIGAGSPLGMQCDLPGPVGESNVYSLRPRGTILLRPITRPGLFHQLAATLATGNKACVEAEEGLLAAVAELPASVRQRLAAGAHDVAAVLAEGEGDAIIAILQDIAARPAGVIPVYAAPPARMLSPAAYPLHGLVEELAISTNTTASGGNASLMAMD